MVWVQDCYLLVKEQWQGDFTGAALELASGAAGTIPGFGTAASIGLDAALAGRDMGLTPFANGGIITRPTASLMGEDGYTEGVFPLEGKRGRDAFVQFGEGLLKAQEKTRENIPRFNLKVCQDILKWKVEMSR